MRISLNIETEQLLRQAAPEVLSALMRRFRDFADAEDAVQEALIAASLQWPRDGVPQNPKGWLFQVACRRMVGFQRSEIARRNRESRVAAELPQSSASPCPEPEEDDALVLLFMCCHPCLTTSSAIALTLRAFGGLSAAEIARAYMVPEATMAQRISRAKQNIKDSGRPFVFPDKAEKDQRLPAVLHVLYLIFSEGYASSGGKNFQRPELTTEAIRLTSILHSALPKNAEVKGLLALMLLTDVRRNTRSGASGEIVPLAEQDRAQWNPEEIERGTTLLKDALALGAVGPYQLQAAIAALHDEAPTASDTDWKQILVLYELLKHMSENPVVKLNHAVAVAMVHGSSAGLRMLGTQDITDQLKGHHRLHSVKGNLFELLGDYGAAIQQYRLAADLTSSVPERNYLLTRAARLSELQDSHR